MFEPSSSAVLAPQTLTEDTFLLAVQELAERDDDLARIVHEYGPPPFWVREPSFTTLIHIILEQQVSLASARAALDRLLVIATPLTPARVLELDDTTMKAVGFSRQKTSYARHLAGEIIAQRFDLDGLPMLDDDAVRAALVKLKGVGLWTADVYLLMALRRPDSWPIGDLALAEGMRRAKRLDNRPAPSELEVLAEPWRPLRAVAARLLWHLYLDGRG